MGQQIVHRDDGVPRCRWGSTSEAYQSYHDHEWGRPTRDDRWIFEKICLEGFQSGLSWLTILNKRDNFRNAFAHFDPERVAQFNDDDVARLMQDAGIVRHRRKIESTIHNAKRACEIRKEQGSLAAFVWQFEPTIHPARTTDQAWMPPSKTQESAALSTELKKRGWTFVGPTTMYAFMQAAGLVNDHAPGCAFRQPCAEARAQFDTPLSKRPQEGRNR